MDIEIPKSLYDYLKDMEARQRALIDYQKTTGPTELLMYGPYGVYRVIPKDDIEYTVVIKKGSKKEVIVTNEIREYKDNVKRTTKR